MFIPPQELKQKITKVFGECKAFDSNSALRAVFEQNAELSVFSGSLPDSANSQQERINAVMAFLPDKQLADGRMVWLLFLEALREQYPVGDAQRNKLFNLEQALRPYQISTIRHQLETNFDETGLETFWRQLFKDLFTEYDFNKDFQPIFNFKRKLDRLMDRCEETPLVRNQLVEALANLAAVAMGAAPSPVMRGQPSKPSTVETVTEIQKRYALLIGVRNYVDANYSRLPHTIHDVNALAQVLEGAGYTVVCLHTDQSEERLKPTRANILSALKNLADSTNPDDLLFVHFGGHGDLDGDRKAYLISSDAYKNTLSDTAIDLTRFKNILSEARAQAKILLLDACHSGIGRSANAMDPDFEKLVHLQAKGMAILASCSKGQIAYEHDMASHGAFTYFALELLKGLPNTEEAERQHFIRQTQSGKRFVTFQGLNDYVTGAVKSWALNKGYTQHPNAITELSGDPPLLTLP